MSNLLASRYKVASTNGSRTGHYRNTVFVWKTNETIVKIGIPEYDKNKDTLTVTMNTKQLKENVDFIVSDDGKNIIAKNNIKWNSTGYGATFTFIVEKPKIDDFIDGDCSVDLTDIYENIDSILDKVDEFERNLTLVVK